MFEILTKALPGSPDLAPATRASVMRAALQQLTLGLRELPVVAPEMSKLQRAQVELELRTAVGAMAEAEQQIEAVQRVAEAEAARA